MAGYSQTPLPQKLGIKPGHRVAMIHSPEGFRQTLGELPESAAVHAALDEAEPFDVILYFTDSASDLAGQFATLSRRLEPSGGLWVAWPKKASGVHTDLTEDRVREIGLRAGLVDNKVCAVDDTWSGLRFVIRLKDRPRKAGKKSPPR
jgi:hypothetical protein